jgi:hypothetical protein
LLLAIFDDFFVRNENVLSKKRFEKEKKKLHSKHKCETVGPHPPSRIVLQTQLSMMSILEPAAVN